MVKNRTGLAALLATVVVAGYVLRFHAPVPEFIRDAAGGIAYVVAASLGVLLVHPRATAMQAAATGFVLTCAVEFLQHWQPPWLQSIRATHLGRALLGTTFLWSDFAPYVAGAILVFVLLSAFRRSTP